MTTRQSRRSALNATRRKSRRIERVPKVNDAVEIWWSVDKTFYRGTLTRRHGEDNFRVVYDDGEMEDLDLTKEYWRFADDPTADRGSASKDNQDVVEVVLDGSDSPTAETPKTTKKPHKKKDKKAQDDKISDKRITKQTTASAGEKPAAAKATSQHSGKNVGASSKRSLDTPTPAKRSLGTSASADQVPDSAAPAASSDTKPSSVTPSRTRAKPKTLRAKPTEKQSARSKTNPTKPNLAPSMEDTASPASHPSTRADSGTKKKASAAQEAAINANETKKPSLSKTKSITESKVKTSPISSNPADSKEVATDVGPRNLAQNGLDKGSGLQDRAKSGPAKAIGKTKKSAQASRAKFTRGKVTKAKAMESSDDEFFSHMGTASIMKTPIKITKPAADGAAVQDPSDDKHIPRMETANKMSKPAVDGAAKPVTPSRKLPSAASPTLHKLKIAATCKAVPKHSPIRLPFRLPERRNEKPASPEAPSEKNAPSFAADRIRRKKTRLASSPNGPNSTDVLEAKGGTSDFGVKQANKHSADNTPLSNAMKNEVTKEISMSDVKVPDGSTTKASDDAQETRGKSSACAEGQVLESSQPRRTTSFASHGEAEAGTRHKRIRADQGLSGTQADMKGTGAESASKRLRGNASQPQRTTQQKTTPQKTTSQRTTDLQFGSGISSAELVSMVTKAMAPSQSMIEDLRMNVQIIYSAVSKMEDVKISAEKDFQAAALESVDKLRNSIQEVKTELSETIEKKAKEAEGRLTATVERLFHELLQKVVTNGPDKVGHNNPEEKEERVTSFSRDGETDRCHGGQPPVLRPSEHNGFQNDGIRGTQSSTTRAMNGRREPPTTIANGNRERVNQRSAMPASDGLKEEGTAIRHAIPNSRVSLLIARQVTVWLLETPHEYDTSSGSVRSWAKRISTIIFKRVVEQLMRFESYVQAYQTLCSSLGNDAVELQWFVSPGVQDNLDRARRNYAAWDPPPSDEEWKSEVWLLKELSERFANALKHCDHNSMADLQACVAVANTAAREEMSPDPRFNQYRNANGSETGATEGNRVFP